MSLVWIALFVACNEPLSLDNHPQRSSDTDHPSEWKDDDTGDTGSEAFESDHCPLDANFPEPTWPTGLPENHGMDPEILAEAAAIAGDNKSNCMVVVRHGTVVGEWYWQDTSPNSQVKNWSVAKAVSSAVVGVAIDRGDIESVDQSAADYILEWQGTEHANIRIKDLISMSSGLRFDMIADNVTMPLATDMTELALTAPVDNPPGALWEYNNHSVQAIEAVLRGATGMAPDDYADEYLFEPIGMDVDWKRDEVGQPAMYMNAKASCRDNARLAYLFMQNGCWNGERVLSESWIDESTSSSTSMNRGYGYWWWLNGETPLLDSVTFEDKGRMLHEFAPHDAYCGVGLGNQFVEVIPSLDLIVVRLGTAPHDDLSAWGDIATLYEDITTDGDQVLHNQILAKVLDAVVE